MNIRVVTRLLGAAAIAIAAQAHVGSPDVYLDGKAGPYQLFITVRPPQVIPGVAALEIRCETPGVTELRAVPIPMGSAAARFAPLPDKLTPSKQDAQFFTGSLWMMAPGSWQVRLTAIGDRGTGVMSVPVPSVAATTRKMQGKIAAMLSLLGLFLVGGVVAVAGASVREAKLEPGVQPTPLAERKGRIAMLIALVVVLTVVWGGNEWWKSEANSYGQTVYRPVQMKASLDAQDLLTLTLTDSGWLQPTAEPRSRLQQFLFRHSIDDLVLDHDHLMHLYAMRVPGLDTVFHLHPDQVEAGVFRLQLPAMPRGNYLLFADIVHANGFPETPVATLSLPTDRSGRPLAGDDASGHAPAWTQSSLTSSEFILPDRYRMQWLRPAGPLHAKQGSSFRFALLDPQGHAPKDMGLYMGMLGHAAFVKTDGTVFAHVHPMGTASMAALSLAQSQNSTTVSTDTSKMDISNMNMPSMQMSPAALPNEVSFPYGFPTPGRYRIFVQMKHGNTIETGIFDTAVE